MVYLRCKKKKDGIGSTPQKHRIKSPTISVRGPELYVVYVFFFLSIYLSIYPSTYTYQRWKPFLIKYLCNMFQVGLKARCQVKTCKDIYKIYSRQKNRNRVQQERATAHTGQSEKKCKNQRQVVESLKQGDANQHGGEEAAGTCSRQNGKVKQSPGRMLFRSFVEEPDVNRDLIRLAMTGLFVLRGWRW